MKKFLFSCIGLFLTLQGFSQLTILNNTSATSLAQSIVGNGITVSNATISCGSTAAGTFTNGTNLGIGNGVILTTGNVQDVGNPGSFFCNNANGNNFSDPNVTAISASARFDNCILQFDFVPLCDTLRITYVFGSDEYPKYISTQFNDVFALFITGPNPAGGNYSAHNMATLPGTSTPVSIQTVNGGWPIGSGASNSGYYIDNFTAPLNDIAYDGFTVPITSVIAIIPCQLYHMKIAVADAVNGNYDSGVFIQGNAFTCNNAPNAVLTATPSCGNNGSAMATVSNYTGTPTYVWSPGGQTSAAINNLSPGIYSCIISYPGLCFADTLDVTVPSNLPTVIPVSSMGVCSNQPVTLTASCTGGTPPYNYAWTIGATPVVFPVIPDSTTTFTVVATDAHGCTTLPQQVLITLNPPLQIQTSAAESICSGDTTMLAATAIGGDGNYSYQWIPSKAIDNPTASNPNAFPDTTTTYAVIVKDNCGSIPDTGFVKITVAKKPTVFFNANNLFGCVPFCVDFSDSLVGSCTSGTWIFGDGKTDIGCGAVTHCYQKSGIYSVGHSITDSIGCNASVEKNNYIEVYPKPQADFFYSPNPVSLAEPIVTFQDQSSNASRRHWSFGDFFSDTTTVQNPLHAFQDTGCYDVQLTVVSSAGCIDSTEKKICVTQDFDFYVPGAFTPNGDGLNDVFLPKATGINPLRYELMIYNRWGKLLFKTNEWGEAWDGREKGNAAIVQEGIYIWMVEVYDLKRKAHRMSGKVEIVK